MRALFAFFKKEMMASFRGARVPVLGVIFIAFGLMNPAIALLTPWMMELLSEELAQTGIVLEVVASDALTSWTQFFKNIPMALIAFVLFYSNSFTKEYNSGTLILILTKGLARYKIVLAKTAVMVIVWTLGYWLCFGVTYGCNAILWDNGIVQALFVAALNWWLFGILTLSLIVLLSTVFKNYVGVLLGTGGSILVLYLVSLLPKLTKYMPTSLMNSTGLMIGAEEADKYLWAAVITAVLSLACIIAGIPIFNKKQL